MGHHAQIPQHVGNHVGLFYVCLLPLDISELVAVLSRGIQAFHIAQGWLLGITAACSWCRRRYRGRPGDRLAVGKTGNIRFSRRIVAIVGMLGCAVFIVPAAMTEHAYTAVYCLTASM